MTNAVHANLFTIQISDHVRFIMQDQRPGLASDGFFEPPFVTTTVADIVMSMGSARALRDMLVQSVKDDVPPMETPNV